MKITWIVNNINQSGGVEQVVCGLSSYFSKERGFALKIISINSVETHTFFPVDESVSIQHLGSDWRTETFPKLLKLIGNTMKSLDSDILLTCHSTISYAVLLNRGKFNGKIVVTQHITNNFFTKKRLLCNSVLFRLADRFVVLTESDRQSYTKFNCPSEVIQNANFKPCHERAALNSKIILAVGRMEDAKGFDMLIRAFSEIADKHPEWKLCICGSGSQEASIRRQIEDLHITDRVLLPGMVKNINDYMHNASVFALSSRFEGFPLVLIESMSHGLPVVSFDLPSVHEICSEKAIMIVDQGDVHGFSKKLDAVVSSASLRQHMGDTAYELSKRYSVASIAERWVSLFQELLMSTI